MRFRLKSLDASGRVQISEISADSENAALTQLTLSGVTPLEISAIDHAAVNPSGLGGRRRLKRQDLTSFIQELATLLSSGVSLSPALATLLEATDHPGLRQHLAVISKGVHDGLPLSHALETSGLILPGYVISLARAGEATGDIGATLRRAAEQMLFDDEIRAQTREAMLYPLILVSVGSAAVLFLFAYVVPRFTAIIQSKKIELPWVSEVVMTLGAFFNSHWLLILAGLAAAAALLWLGWQSPTIQAALLRGLSRLPVLSPWIASTECARWTSSLAILLQSRVPILQALDLCAASLRLQSLANQLRYAADDVRVGKRLSDTIGERRLLTGSALTMLKVGEQVGDPGAMLAHIARQASDQQRALQHRVVSLMEPISIVLIGGLVAFVMIGIILAMTSLTDFKL